MKLITDYSLSDPQKAREVHSPVLPAVTFHHKSSKTHPCSRGARQTAVTSGDPCVDKFPCPEALVGLRLAKGHVKGGLRHTHSQWEGDGKRDFKKDGGCPFQHPNGTQFRLFQDKQLRWKCSPEGVGIERSPVSLVAEHKVCLWWGLLVTAERCRSVYLSQPLLHMLTEKADSCIHVGGTLIHS